MVLGSDWDIPWFWTMDICRDGEGEFFKNPFIWEYPFVGLCSLICLVNPWNVTCVSDCLVLAFRNLKLCFFFFFAGIMTCIVIDLSILIV